MTSHADLPTSSREEFRAVVRRPYVIPPSSYRRGTRVPRHGTREQIGGVYSTREEAEQHFARDGRLVVYVETDWDRNGTPRSGRWAEVEIVRVERRVITDWEPLSEPMTASPPGSLPDLATTQIRELLDALDDASGFDPSSHDPGDRRVAAAIEALSAAFSTSRQTGGDA